MSSQYNGQVATVQGTLPFLLGIVSSTNTNPIVVTTNVAHNLTSGDTVDITRHTVNYDANGVYPATVLSSTTFSIPKASTSGSPGGATGYVQSLAVGATGPIPSDGDNDNNASIAPMLERLSDQVAFLGYATGVAKLAGRMVLTWSDLTGSSSWGVANNTTVANTWYPLVTNGSLTEMTAIGQEGAGFVTSPATPFCFDGPWGGYDTVHVRLKCDLTSGDSAGVRMGIFFRQIAQGSAAPGFGTYSQAVGCSRPCAFNSATGVNTCPVDLDAWIPVASGTIGQRLYLQPAVYSLAATGTHVWTVAGDSMLVVEYWRNTGMLQ